MKAYAYLRVSGKGQLKKSGFKRQKETIEQLAKAKKIEIVKVFKEEGISGTTDETERPAFQEMVSEILRNGVRTIIVEGLDRLAREYRIQETLLIYLASKNISLLSANTGEDVTSEIQKDPMKKALIQIQGVFAELEKNLLVKKLRKSRQLVKRQKGKCEGRKGYNDNPELKKEILLQIRRLRRKPKGGRRKTYIQVAEELNKMGYKTLLGHEWIGSAVQNFLQKV